MRESYINEKITYGKNDFAKISKNLATYRSENNNNNNNFVELSIKIIM